MNRNKRGQFKKGASGNPNGRPVGTTPAAKLRTAIQDDLPEIIEAMTQAAKEGDTAAAKLLLDRVAPAYKSIAPPASLPATNGGLVDQAQAILAAATRGDLPPDTAAQLVAAVGQLARIVEIDQLEQRLERLERINEGNP